MGVLGCRENPFITAKAIANLPVDVDVQRMYQVSQGDEVALKELISKWKIQSSPIFSVLWEIWRIWRN
ncbi:MAG: hypothetical protein VX130_02270 [Verrucomicrobiota bacterium]|nr:hypothetical protein [Verrucomicrobiota bacterium]